MSPLVNAGAVDLFYEEVGEGPDVVVLIAGRGGQLTDWHDDLVRSLAERGFRVIRFDNRDSGLSTHFEGVPVPSALEVVQGAAQPPYSLEDMSDDVAGLLKALDISSATVVGLSLGAMIAQCFAIAHPSLVRGLVLISGTTGARDVGMPSGEVL